MEEEDLNECLTMFYATIRREEGTEFKIHAIERDAFFWFISK